MGKRYDIETDLKPIMSGEVALPNPEPVADVAVAILGYQQMHHGQVLLPGQTNKTWNVHFFLDRGQGGQLYGSGIVAWTRWDNEKRGVSAYALKFAICQHTKVADPGANPSRGWHPGRCSKCGLDMTIDSGD